jgi:hypothetical protein
MRLKVNSSITISSRGSNPIEAIEVLHCPKQQIGCVIGLTKEHSSQLQDDGGSCNIGRVQ